MREFGSEHPAALPDGYFATFENYGHCTWLGRVEALHLVALKVNESFNHIEQIGDDACLLLPLMVDPFEKAGWKVVYYRLNEFNGRFGILVKPSCYIET